MNNVLLLFLSLSLSGSMLALILLALKPFIKSKLSQTWQYYIWLIVILRILLPITPQLSMAGEITRYFQDAMASPAVIEVNTDINGNQDNMGPIFPQVPNTSQIILPPQVSEAETTARSVYWNEILNNVWVLWLGVALLLFVNKITSYRSFVRFVKVGAKKITDPNIIAIYEAELAAARIKRSLLLYVNEQVNSPMLVGILQPSIVIPILKVSDDELRHILRHELTHHKRKDFLYKWIVQIAFSLHWFNPLIYLINKDINRLCELSCDETVIKHLDADTRVIYGDALVATLKAPWKYNEFSITMSDNAGLVKERLDVIMSFKKKSGLAICGAFALTVLFLCGFAFSGAYALPSPNDSNATYHMHNETTSMKTAAVLGDTWYLIETETQL